jgi:hypothetical protein
VARVLAADEEEVLATEGDAPERGLGEVVVGRDGGRSAEGWPPERTKCYSCAVASTRQMVSPARQGLVDIACLRENPFRAMDFPADPGRAIAPLLESLLLTLPRQWATATLTVEPAGEAVRITNVGAEVAPAGAGRMPPPVATQEDLVARSNEALGVLAGATGWRGPTLRVDRANDASVRLTLIDAEGAEHSRLDVQRDAVLSLTWTDPLLDAMEDAQARLGDAQAAFDTTIQGFRQWGYDQDTGELTFTLAGGEPWAGHAEIVGSWAPEQGTWRWAWANRSVQAKCCQLVAGVRDASRSEPGLGALAQASIPCTQRAALHLALLAGARLGARGLFGIGEPLIFFAVTG